MTPLSVQESIYFGKLHIQRNCQTPDLHTLNSYISATVFHYSYNPWVTCGES